MRQARAVRALCGDVDRTRARTPSRRPRGVPTPLRLRGGHGLEHGARGGRARGDDARCGPRARGRDRGLPARLGRAERRADSAPPSALRLRPQIPPHPTAGCGSRQRRIRNLRAGRRSGCGQPMQPAATVGKRTEAVPQRPQQAEVSPPILFRPPSPGPHYGILPSVRAASGAAARRAIARSQSSRTRRLNGPTTSQ
jgi:hypothetical protein